MRAEYRNGDVIVVGAGLAGLSAADHLLRQGFDPHVLEAHPVTGGRVLATPAGLDTGAEFVGQPHTALRALIAELGLCLESPGLDRSPILWRVGGLVRSSLRPPMSLRELWKLTSALWHLRRRSMALDANAPWLSAGIADLDSTTLGCWLADHGVTRRGLDLADALIGGFATRSIFDMSAAHAAWWIASADGLVSALRSGQQYVVPGGAHQIPQRLTQRLGHRIHCDAPVRAIRALKGRLEIVADKDIWHARATIVAVPLPCLPDIEFDPALPQELQSASAELSYGTAVKIAARATTAPPVRHRTVAGGHPLAVAWRRDRELAGISIGHAPTTELIDDLAGVFGLRSNALADVAVTDWTHREHIGGSYLVYRPGQIEHLAPARRLSPAPSIRLAGSDFSTWPNSMEGAVRSGREAADALSRALRKGEVYCSISLNPSSSTLRPIGSGL